MGGPGLRCGGRGGGIEPKRKKVMGMDNSGDSLGRRGGGGGGFGRWRRRINSDGQRKNPNKTKLD